MAAHVVEGSFDSEIFYDFIIIGYELIVFVIGFRWDVV